MDFMEKCINLHTTSAIFSLYSFAVDEFSVFDFLFPRFTRQMCEIDNIHGSFINFFLLLLSLKSLLVFNHLSF